jgi:hypothetical protein
MRLPSMVILISSIKILSNCSDAKIQVESSTDLSDGGLIEKDTVIPFHLTMHRHWTLLTHLINWR